MAQLVNCLSFKREALCSIPTVEELSRLSTLRLLVLGRQTGIHRAYKLLPLLVVSSVRKPPCSPVPPPCLRKSGKIAEVHIWIYSGGSWATKTKEQGLQKLPFELQRPQTKTPQGLLSQGPLYVSTQSLKQPPALPKVKHGTGTLGVGIWLSYIQCGQAQPCPPPCLKLKTYGLRAESTAEAARGRRWNPPSI